MKPLTKAIAITAGGIAAIYWLRSTSGQGRPSLADGTRWRVGRVDSPARSTAGARRRDARNGAAIIQHDRDIRDHIRARLDGWVADPASIEVVVNDGSVGLRGAATDDEVERLLAAVREIPGVRHVDNRLESRDVPHSTLADLVSNRPSVGAATDAASER